MIDLLRSDGFWSREETKSQPKHLQTTGRKPFHQHHRPRLVMNFFRLLFVTSSLLFVQFLSSASTNKLLVVVSNAAQTSDNVDDEDESALFDQQHRAMSPAAGAATSSASPFATIAFSKVTLLSDGISNCLPDPFRESCSNGIASARYFYRNITAEMGSAHKEFIAFFDKDTAFVQMHPSNYAVNIDTFNEMEIKYYFADVSVFASREELRRLDLILKGGSNANTTDFRSQLLQANVKILPTDMWFGLLNRQAILFDGQVGLIIVTSSAQTFSLMAKDSILSATAYLRDAMQVRTVVVLNDDRSPFGVNLLEQLKSNPPDVLIHENYDATPENEQVECAQVASPGDEAFMAKNPNFVTHSCTLIFGTWYMTALHLFYNELDNANINKDNKDAKLIKVVIESNLVGGLGDVNNTEFARASTDPIYLADQAFLKLQAEKALAFDPVVGTTNVGMPDGGVSNLSYFPCYVGECPQGTLYGKSLMHFVPEADLVIANSGGFRGKGWSAGEIHMSYIWEMIPFPNTIVILEVIGFKIWELMNCSAWFFLGNSSYQEEADRMLQGYGWRIEIAANRPLHSNRLLSVSILNKKTNKYEPLERTRVYTVAADAYLYNWMPDIAPILQKDYDRETFKLTENITQDALASYLRANQPYDEIWENNYVKISVNDEVFENPALATPSDRVFMNWTQDESFCASDEYWRASLMSCLKCPTGEGQDPNDKTRCMFISASSGDGISSRALVAIITPIVVVFVLFVIIALGTLYYIDYKRRKSTRNTASAPRTSEHTTIIFTDIQSSTKLWGTVPASMSVALETHHRVIREVISKYGGYEVKTIGDSFMIACNAVHIALQIAVAIQERLHVEEWPRAISEVYACEGELNEADLLNVVDDEPSNTILQKRFVKKRYHQQRLMKDVLNNGGGGGSEKNNNSSTNNNNNSNTNQNHDRNDPAIYSYGVRVRIGLNCGVAEAVFDEISKGYDYYGNAVNLAARIEAAAQGGQILANRETIQLLSESMIIAPPLPPAAMMLGGSNNNKEPNVMILHDDAQPIPSPTTNKNVAPNGNDLSNENHQQQPEDEQQQQQQFLPPILATVSEDHVTFRAGDGDNNNEGDSSGGARSDAVSSHNGYNGSLHSYYSIGTSVSVGGGGGGGGGGKRKGGLLGNNSDKTQLPKYFANVSVGDDGCCYYFDGGAMGFSGKSNNGDDEANNNGGGPKITSTRQIQISWYTQFFAVTDLSGINGSTELFEIIPMRLSARSYNPTRISKKALVTAAHLQNVQQHHRHSSASNQLLLLKQQQQQQQRSNDDGSSSGANNSKGLRNNNNNDSSGGFSPSDGRGAEFGEDDGLIKPQEGGVATAENRSTSSQQQQQHRNGNIIVGVDNNYYRGGGGKTRSQSNQNLRGLQQQQQQAMMMTDLDQISGSSRSSYHNDHTTVEPVFKGYAFLARESFLAVMKLMDATTQLRMAHVMAKAWRVSYNHQSYAQTSDYQHNNNNNGNGGGGGGGNPMTNRNGSAGMSRPISGGAGGFTNSTGVSKTVEEIIDEVSHRVGPLMRRKLGNNITIEGTCQNNNNNNFSGGGGINVTSLQSGRVRQPLGNVQNGIMTQQQQNPFMMNANTNNSNNNNNNATAATLTTAVGKPSSPFLKSEDRRSINNSKGGLQTLVASSLANGGAAMGGVSGGGIEEIILKSGGVGAAAAPSSSSSPPVVIGGGGGGGGGGDANNLNNGRSPAAIHQGAGGGRNGSSNNNSRRRDGDDDSVSSDDSSNGAHAINPFVASSGANHHTNVSQQQLPVMVAGIKNNTSSGNNNNSDGSNNKIVVGGGDGNPIMSQQQQQKGMNSLLGIIVAPTTNCTSSPDQSSSGDVTANPINGSSYSYSSNAPTISSTMPFDAKPSHY